MAASTNLNVLMQASACYQCIPTSVSDAVITWMLMNIAGLDLTPSQLLQAAACYQCVPPGQQPEIHTMMLDSILTGLNT